MPELRDDSIQARVYTRRRGKTPPRYYADFRDFSHVGGGQEALVTTGSRRATTDEDEALELAELRLKALEDAAHQQLNEPEPVTSELTDGSLAADIGKSGLADRVVRSRPSGASHMFFHTWRRISSCCTRAPCPTISSNDPS